MIADTCQLYHTLTCSICAIYNSTIPKEYLTTTKPPSHGAYPAHTKRKESKTVLQTLQKKKSRYLQIKGTHYSPRLPQNKRRALPLRIEGNARYFFIYELTAKAFFATGEGRGRWGFTEVGAFPWEKVRQNWGYVR